MTWPGGVCFAKFTLSEPNMCKPVPENNPYSVSISWQWILYGKPAQNAEDERFNRTLRHIWQNEHLFESFEHAQEMATE